MYLTYALSSYLYKFIAGAYSKQILRLGVCAACSFSYVIVRGPRRVLSSGCFFHRSHRAIEAASDSSLISNVCACVRECEREKGEPLPVGV